MQSRRPLVALLLAVLLLGACDRTAPAPTQPPAPALSTAGDPALADAIRARIGVLFLDQLDRHQAYSHFNQVQLYWDAGLIQQARDQVNVMVRFTVDVLAAGSIADCDGTGPDSPAECVVAFANDLLTFVGMPTVPLGSNATVTLVFPRDTAQTVDSRLDLYAVIPGGSLKQVALFYVERDTTGAEVSGDFETASDLYEVRFIPASTEFDLLTIAVCAAPPPPPGARLAHEREPGQVDVLDPVAVNIVCDDDVAQTGAPLDGWREGGVTRVLASLVNRVAGLLAPSPLYAGHAATAGTVEELSPFQIVVTGTEIEASASGATYGQSVDVSGLLRRQGIGTPLAGRSLSLSVDGNPVGAQTTDASGTAAWTVGGLGAGTHGYAIAYAGEFTTTGDTLLRPSTAGGTFSVGQAPLTLTASSATVTFGDPISACTVGYSGLVGGDTPASIGPLSTCSYPTAPGTYVVSPSAITPANYAVSRVNGTFVHNYASSTGTFVSPLPMREIKRGSKIPVKFELTTSSGTPIPGRLVHLRAIQVSSTGTITFNRALGYLAYNASKGTYDLGVDTSGWPLGIVRLVAELDDSTVRSVDEIIK